MSGKNFSAAQRLAQSLYAPPHYFSGRTLVAKSFDALSLHNRMTHKRAWPQREETYAAIQLMRQNRSWNNVRKFGVAINQSMSIARRGITPRRNNILAAKNASVKRSAMLRKDPSNGVKSKSLRNTAIDGVHLAESISREDSTNRDHSRSEYDGDTKSESDTMDVRSIRDAVFGLPENNDEEREQQREADNDLLKRISKQRPFHAASNLSKKVIAPYQTYKSHRNCWAEFRHRLVYGASNYY